MSIVSGYFFGFLTVLIIHFLPKDWSILMPQGTRFFTGKAKATHCSYTCFIGEHHSFNCNGMEYEKIQDNAVGLGGNLTATFEHYFLILIIGSILSLLIYVFKKVNFNVVK
jgi:hypothetical protein